MDEKTAEKVKKMAKMMKNGQKSLCEQLATSEEAYKAYLADVVCDMLRRGQSVSFETLIDECSHRRDDLEEEQDYKYNVNWYLSGSAIRFLQGLTAKNTE